jgi:RNA polymerase II subunit A small phosphatase-like protein
MSPSDVNPRPLLILDVDETLIFGAESVLDRLADFRVGPFHIYRRPHLAEFLATCYKSYDLAIWSSGTSDYVGGIANQIGLPLFQWRFVWGRERCTPRQNPETHEIDYIKDLKKVKRLGYHLDRILFVDDTAAKLSRNFGNAIYIAPYFGATSDDELPILAQYLHSIRKIENFRLLEKRGWRGHARQQ